MDHANNCNPFHTPQRVLSGQLCTIIRLAWPYLTRQDRAQCASINSLCHSAFVPSVWHSPTFNDGHLHDAVHLLNRFIDLLPDLTITRKHIRQLDLSDIEESLYDRVHPYFFRHLVWFVPNLQSLKMRRVSFFAPSSLRGLPSDQTWQLPQLRELDLSQADHVTDDLLVSLAAALPKLQRLKLDMVSSSSSDRGVAAFAYQCDQLQSISLRDCTIHDMALSALAKFRKIDLKEVDLAGCRRITTAGLAIMGKYNIKLQYLSLAQTPCDAETLEAFRTGLANYLCYLDISGCKRLDQEPDRVARCLSQSRLIKLVVSMPVANAMVRLHQEQLLPSVSSSPMEFLEVDGLPEHTPMTFLDQLIQTFSSVKHIKLTRGYYDTDFMGGYLSGDAAVKNEITEAQVDKFNLKQHVVVILVNKREKADDLGIHSW